jgi:hypothetical protein
MVLMEMGSDLDGEEPGEVSKCILNVVGPGGYMLLAGVFGCENTDGLPDALFGVVAVQLAQE